MALAGPKRKAVAQLANRGLALEVGKPLCPRLSRASHRVAPRSSLSCELLLLSESPVLNLGRAKGERSGRTHTIQRERAKSLY